VRGDRNFRRVDASVDAGTGWRRRAILIPAAGTAAAWEKTPEKLRQYMRTVSTMLPASSRSCVIDNAGLLQPAGSPRATMPGC